MSTPRYYMRANPDYLTEFQVYDSYEPKRENSTGHWCVERGLKESEAVKLVAKLNEQRNNDVIIPRYKERMDDILKIEMDAWKIDKAEALRALLEDIILYCEDEKVVLDRLISRAKAEAQSRRKKMI